MLKGCVVHRYSWVNNKMDFQMMISHAAVLEKELYILNVKFSWVNINMDFQMMVNLEICCIFKCKMYEKYILNVKRVCALQKCMSKY